MTRSIFTTSTSLAQSLGRYLVRGLAVLALMMVWSAAHIGTYTLGLAGVTSIVMASAVTPADAGYRRRWWRRRWWRRWWHQAAYRLLKSSPGGGLFGFLQVNFRLVRLVSEPLFIPIW